MSQNVKSILKAKVINGWNLFWLISIPMSLILIAEMTTHDLSSGPGVSEMIGYSVKFAVPFIFLVVAISSLQVLFPGPIPMWLLRNRKHIGLCFAVAMAWQGTFIFMMSNIHRDYYFEEIFYLRDELEGSTGYIFLAAMVLTSFRFGRRFLKAEQWKLLHKSGLYFLWAYPFSVYWWNLSYYPDPQPIDHFFYWFGFTAFAARIAAWGKVRHQVAVKRQPDYETPLPQKLLGVGLISLGLVVASVGLNWQKQVTGILTEPGWSAELVLWLPYWPFEPFLSLFIIGLGTMLMTRQRKGDSYKLADARAG